MTMRLGFSVKRAALVLGAALLFFGFCALGSWQLNRLQWKLDLIDRVESRAYASPMEIPAEDKWSTLNAENAEYLSVVLRGRWEEQFNTYVQASTQLGAGFWLMTPLRLESGALVWVNRGFVSSKSQTVVPSNELLSEKVEMAGLLRISEPNGAFLRENDANADRWYSRDVEALSRYYRLARVAPFFVDVFVESDSVGGKSALSAQNKPFSKQALDDTGEVLVRRVEVRKPVTGLTVLTFRNNHLSYAITWFALAAMVAGLSFWLWRRRGEDIPQ